MAIKPSYLKSEDRRQENTNSKNAISWRIGQKKNPKTPIYLEFLLKHHIQVMTSHKSHISKDLNSYYTNTTLWSFY